MIASHYAEPIDREIGDSTTLRTAPARTADAICKMTAGDTFLMLDESRGWAWGYAGEERRVGYLPAAALAEN